MCLYWSFLSHIKRRTNDDRFSSSQWESFFYSSLGVSTPALIGPPQQTTFFLSTLLGIICRLSNRKERGDIEIKDYVDLQKSQTPPSL